MIKKIFLGILLVGVVAALVFGAIQRTSAQLDANTSINGRGSGQGGQGGGQGGGRPEWAGGGQASGQPETGAEGSTARGYAGNPVVSVQPGTLDNAEKEGLLFMIEEEKLARDVYLALYAKWNLATFQNIAGSEQTHMDSLKALLDGYGLTNPTVGAANGSFTNASLQALYDQLIAQGSKSLADAIKVGAAIEEIDILDLEKRIAQTDEASIQSVYQNLLRGSENHLRAFTQALKQQTGEVYQPQHLSAEEYGTIVSGSNGYRGNGRGRSGR